MRTTDETSTDSACPLHEHLGSLRHRFPAARLAGADGQADRTMLESSEAFRRKAVKSRGLQSYERIIVERKSVSSVLPENLRELIEWENRCKDRQIPLNDKK